jgi:hypothetical protein
VLQYEASGSRPGPNSDYTVDDLRSLVSVNIEDFLFISQVRDQADVGSEGPRKQRQYHVDAGHLALDTAADEIAALVRGTLSVLDVESGHVLTRKAAVYAI